MKIVLRKHKRFLKLIARMTLYSLLLFGVLIFIAIRTLERAWPEQKLRPYLEKEFSHFLKRKLTIETVEWGLRPRPVLIGRNVQLWEDDDHEMASSPQVNMTLSLQSVFKKKVEFREIEFISSKGTLRVRKDRTLDLIQMINEIRADLRMKLAMPAGKPLPYLFHRFSIVGGRLFIIDETLKPEPLKASFLVNAFGDIRGPKKKRTFPFIFNAQIDSQEETRLAIEKLIGNFEKLIFQKTGFIRIQGELGDRSRIRINSNQFPLSIFSEHIPALQKWNGSASVQAELIKKVHGWSFQAKGECENLKPLEDLPWPQMKFAYDIKSDGESVVTAEMTDSEMDAAINLTLAHPNDKSIQVALASTQLDIENLVDYWKTGQSFWKISESEVEMIELSTGPTGMVMPGWAANLSARAQRIQFRGENFDDMELDARRTSEGSIYVDALSLKGLGGDLIAKCSFIVKQSTVVYLGILPPHFSTEWHLSDVDLLKTSLLVGLPPLISGIGSTQGKLDGNFSNMSGRETQGNIKLNLSNGVVSGVPGLVKTFTRLNIRSLIKKEDEKNKEGLPFQTATASVVIRDGIAKFEPPALFTNDTLQVAFMGTVDLEKKTVKGNVIIHFVTFISELIGAIPGVRTILLGDQKSMVPLWIDVDGPLHDPQVNVRQSKWFTDPLLNTVGRIFGLPAKLIKSLGPSEEKQ